MDKRRKARPSTSARQYLLIANRDAAPARVAWRKRRRGSVRADGCGLEETRTRTKRPSPQRHPPPQPPPTRDGREPRALVPRIPPRRGLALRHLLTWFEDGRMDSSLGCRSARARASLPRQASKAQTPALYGQRPRAGCSRAFAMSASRRWRIASSPLRTLRVQRNRQRQAFGQRPKKTPRHAFARTADKAKHLLQFWLKRLITQ